MQAELKVIGGKQQGSTIPLTMKKFLIGREKDCHLRPNNDLISRHHCVVTVDEFTVRVRDLGSTNGTFVNSERIQGQVVLNDGDKLSIGKLRFEIRIREASDAAGAETISAAALDDTDTGVFTAKPTPIPSTVPEDSPTVPEDVTSSALAIPPKPEPAPGDPNGSGVFNGDTTMIPPPQSPAADPPQQPQAPVAPPAPGVPQGQFVQQPQGVPQQLPPYQMPPQQFPMQPFYQQPMMPQPFVQQPMPMMPQPVQLAPQQPYPTEIPGSPPPQQPPASNAPAQKPELDVRLPPPEETGAKKEESQAGSTGAASKDGDDAVDPRSAAEDIIRQYTQRAPGE